MIHGLQYLRAAAATAVVVFHAEHAINALSGRNSVFFEVGAAGVDIFFVLSGLVMWLSTARRNPTGPSFLIGRIRRIVPLYWILTLLQVALLLVLPQLFNSSQFDGTHALASLGFIAHPHPVLGVYAPVLVAGWTLNMEMFFYLLFSLTLFFSMHKRPWVLAAMLIGVTLIGQSGLLSGAIGFYASPLVLEFLSGVLLGAWIAPRTGPGTPPRPLLWGGFGLGLLWLVLAPAEMASGMHRLWTWGAPAFLIVACLYLAELHGKMPRIRWLELLGDASYAIYLGQAFTLPVVRIAWSKLDLPLSSTAHLLGFYGAAVVVTLIGGVMIHLLIEKPVSRWLTPARVPHRREVPVSAP